MLLKNETYDLLKLLATRILPALATLVGTVGMAVQWKWTELAVTVISAVAAFIGQCINVSSKAYYASMEVGNDA